MNVPAELFQIIFVAAVAVLPAICVRLLAGREDFGFDAIIRFDATTPWPKGVQEEEPLPWNFGAARA